MTASRDEMTECHPNTKSYFDFGPQYCDPLTVS
jgi:hypothetical protein